MTFPGKLYVWEGADDLGKTTQIDLVYNYLLDKNEKVIKTREPGGTKIGSKIRDLILDSKNPLPKVAELLLFMADRSIHVNQVIKPYLEYGYTVLCDRFHLSTLVYQHHLKGNSFSLVNGLNTEILDGVYPYKTFIFYGDRITQNKKDAYEVNLGDKSHEKLNSYYYEYGFYKNHFLINANRPKEEIFEELISYME